MLGKWKIVLPVGLKVEGGAWGLGIRPAQRKVPVSLKTFENSYPESGKASTVTSILND